MLIVSIGECGFGHSDDVTMCTIHLLTGSSAAPSSPLPGTTLCRRRGKCNAPAGWDGSRCTPRGMVCSSATANN
eukprot:7954054-Pyramimonas_sp.AAC.4